MFLDNLTENNCKLILQSISEIVWAVDLSTNKLQILCGHNNLLDYNNSEVTSLMDFAEKIILPEDKVRAKNDFHEFVSDNDIFLNRQYRVKNKHGEIKWLLINGKRIKFDNSAYTILIGTVSDITERKKAEEQMHYMAYHDQLTGLPNKASFLREIQRAIDGFGNRDVKSAVIFVDIDNFTSINDSFNHQYGDTLLKIVSELLKFCVRDYGFVSRDGGDEFLIFISDIMSMQQLKKVIHHINESFQNPFELLDVETYVTVSMGIYIFDNKDPDPNMITKNVDIAMHEAKMHGKNNFVFYDDELGCAIDRRKKIESSLQRSLQNGELEIYYQPQVDINYNKISGMEALLRWNSPEFGTVAPSEFIPIAEESGLICKIGEWVLKNACLQAKEWKERGYTFDTISVNISPKQLKNRYFVKLIDKVLQESKLDPKHLEIEITEGTLIKSVEEKSKLLQGLIDRNIKVSIDDFGKGYSSLSYLTSLPISTIKIDKSFVDQLCSDEKTRCIIECIIELSKKLHYNVIAEGVEKQEQKEILKNMGCNLVQGYYYSKPLTVSAIEKTFSKEEACYA
ncbi:MAG: EAL domain-containing protein [Sedimentibacter sp.]|uniref:sensor domain-containing protein n=1 Tax=Sedimentibacter sp. TaxID=1960295 RepID=UPI0031591E64